MIYGVWQLAKQSLMSDARRPATHLVRFGLATVLYFAICCAHLLTITSAAGLALFHAQLMITAFYISMNAIFGFSQAITEEKEEGTLGLLRLTDISPLAIIMGKMAARLVDSALLLALQFPFTIVAITLGGVSWAQVYAAYGALAAYLWLLASIGILASVVQPTGAMSARWTGIVVALYALPPYALIGPWAWYRLASAYEVISLPLRLTAVTESGFKDSIWCSQIAFGFLAGLACLAWAVFVFDTAIVGRAEPVRRLTRPLLTKRASQRVWSQPVIWREFTFLTGGRRWIYIRIAVPLVILLSMVPIRLPNGIGRTFAWTAIWTGLFSLIDGTWTASRLFRDEIKDQTWSTLVQTPHDISRLAMDKALGWALGVLPSVVIPYLCILVAVSVDPVPDQDMCMQLIIGALTIEVAIMAYLHLLILMTLHFGWSATPLTLTISVAAGWLYVVTAYSNRLSMREVWTLFAITTVVLILISFALQRQIVRRLTTLAETA